MTAVPQALNTVNTKISPKVSSVINKLMAKRPNARFKTWDEVRQELINSSQNVGNHKSAIDNILQKKISRDLEAEEVLSEQQVKEKELKRKSDILNFQFKNEIVQPVNEFVDNFNKVSGAASTMNMSKVSVMGDLTSDIRFDRKAINIWFHRINDADVLSHYVNDVWGERRLHVTKPTLNGKPVLAWGGIESSDGTGLNIVLVASETDEYGDWYLLKNTHSAFGHRENRPEPFAFKNDELVKEIRHVGAMHIYNLNVNQLDINDVIEFISGAL